MTRHSTTRKAKGIRETAAEYQVDSQLTKVTRHGQVTLPSFIRKLLGIEEGDIVEFAVQGEKVVMTPKKLIDKSQAYFWTEAWQRGEREAEADIRSGRVKRFRSVEDLMKDLEG